MTALNLRKGLAIGACSLVLATAMTGCGSDEKETPAAKSGDSSSSADSSMEPKSEMVGAGCAAYAKAVPDGAGSVDGMAQDKVAVAASNNPLLKTLTAAVSGKLNPKVNLVDVLNGGEYTVFAPVDDAFAKLPKSAVKSLAKPANAKSLSGILTYHVVKGQMAPSDVTGAQTTVEGKTLEVAGSGDNLTVNGAKVICGGVKTANATVYLIDTVLDPATKGKF